MTPNYCTDQFLLVKYPTGAAGKFFITSLFLLPGIAPWQADIKDFRAWFESAWPEDCRHWVKVEPNQPWGLDFYSRRLDRNNTISCNEFNANVIKHATPYFHRCWQQGLMIVDHWHKRWVPEWFRNSRQIEITLSDASLDAFRACVSQKLFLWDHASGGVISTLDHPDWAWRKTNVDHIREFGNASLLKGFANYDDFFYNYLLEQPYVKPFRNTNHEGHCLMSLDFKHILQLDSYIDHIDQLARHFGGTVDHDILRFMHATWIRKSGITPI